jgi:hypothetical protein
MKHACRLSLLFLLAFSGITVAQSDVLSGTAMLDCSGFPCVDVVLASGKHLRLLVDTGNVNSLIDTAVAREMGLALTPVNGADGKPRPGYSRSALAGIKLGDASLGDVKVLVLDLASYIKRDRFPASDGTLAYTAFKDRLLELDYKHRQVRISQPLTTQVPCPGFCGTLSNPTFGKQGPPILVATGFSINGQPVTAQIDTVFSGSMLIYPTAVEKLGLKASAQTTQKRFFKYTDDGVDMLEAKASTESFGKATIAQDSAIYFATASVHLPDGMFDATVGHELFEHAVLTLDFHDQQMWMME